MAMNVENHLEVSYVHFHKDPHGDELVLVSLFALLSDRALNLNTVEIVVGGKFTPQRVKALEAQGHLFVGFAGGEFDEHGGFRDEAAAVSIPIDGLRGRALMERLDSRLQAIGLADEYLEKASFRFRELVSYIEITDRYAVARPLGWSWNMKQGGRSQSWKAISSDGGGFEAVSVLRTPEQVRKQLLRTFSEVIGLIVAPDPKMNEKACELVERLVVRWVCDNPAIAFPNRIERGMTLRSILDGMEINGRMRRLEHKPTRRRISILAKRFQKAREKASWDPDTDSRRKLKGKQRLDDGHHSSPFGFVRMIARDLMRENWKAERKFSLRRGEAFRHAAMRLDAWWAMSDLFVTAKSEVKGSLNIPIPCKWDGNKLGRRPYVTVGTSVNPEFAKAARAGGAAGVVCANPGNSKLFIGFDRRRVSDRDVSGINIFLGGLIRLANERVRHDGELNGLGSYMVTDGHVDSHDPIYLPVDGDGMVYSVLHGSLHHEANAPLRVTHAAVALMTVIVLAITRLDDSVVMRYLGSGSKMGLIETLIRTYPADRLEEGLRHLLTDLGQHAAS